MIPSQLYPALFATVLAIACATTGALVEAGAGRGRIFLPVSGALLICVAVFGIAPELVRAAGWLPAAGLAAATWLILFFLDTHGYPLCPSCSHGGGFAASLSIAAAVHAFLDGWGLSIVRSSWSGAIPAAIFGAILLHKVPEGLALGAMLRASLPRLAGVFALAVAAETMTLAGAAVGLRAVPSGWSEYPLALATGAFLFLGVHALRGSKHGHAPHRHPSVSASSQR